MLGLHVCMCRYPATEDRLWDTAHCSTWITSACKVSVQLFPDTKAPQPQLPLWALTSQTPPTDGFG